LNTAKQVNIIIGLLMVGIVGTAFYYMFDSGVNIVGVSFGNRQAAARERQETTTAERGAFLFARYCRACHGLTGQGGVERTGLPGAQLNADANHPPTLPDSQLTPKQQRYTDTITCGRVGTQMPPWSVDQGGALNFYQIQQIVTLITSKFAPEGWDKLIEYGNEADAQNPPIFLTKAIGVDDTVLSVNSTGTFAENTLLRIGLEEPGEPYELMLITAVDKSANTITVQRGPDVTLNDAVLGSDKIEHKAGAEVFNGPLLPTGQITGDPNSKSDAPCGQKKAVVAASAPVQVADGATITLGDNFFQVGSSQNPEMDVAPGAAITVTLDNTGTAVHDMRIAGPDGKFNTADDIVSVPDAITGGTQGTIAFTLAAGTYNYQCDFHTDQMKGQIVAK
jgi:mono/diheme cytochrome c family protein